MILTRNWPNRIYILARNLFLYFFKVHGLSQKDNKRLKIGLLNGLLHCAKPSFFSYISGSTSLIIKTWDGYTFHIRPRTNDLSLATLINEYYELNEWFIPNAKGVVIDVGACIGGYTVRANSLANLVVAIEPQKNNFKILRKNIDINFNSEKVILINKAIGDKKCTAPLRLPVDNKINLGTYSIIRNVKNNSIIEEVQVDTLDNIIASLGLKKINLIKIDIEGALIIALNGMSNTLEITDKLIVEIWEKNECIIDKIINMDFKLIDKKKDNYFFARSRAN